MRLLKTSFSFAVLLTFCINAQAQVVPGNLVPNYSFDEVDGKPKEAGSIELATGWSSPTDIKADLFYIKGKNGFGTEEDNYIGGEKPWDGDAYAGIKVYEYSRRGTVEGVYSFLQAELNEPLQAGRVYCGKFMLSFADLAQYATNNVGMYISAERPDGKAVQGYSLEPQIMHSRNKIIEMQAAWITVCRLYKAKGGEKFITIGNFKRNEETEGKKMKKPRGFTSPQSPIGYYFIESVSIAPLDSLDHDCVCETGGAGNMQTVYTNNISDSLNMKWIDLDQVLSEKHAYFPAMSAEILESSYAQINDVVKMLEEQPDAAIVLTGHTDATEQVKIDGAKSEDISALRAKAVKEYLVSKGISSARITHEGKKSTEALDEGGTMDAIAKNRRVDFNIKK